MWYLVFSISTLIGVIGTFVCFYQFIMLIFDNWGHFTNWIGDGDHNFELWDSGRHRFLLCKQIKIYTESQKIESL